MENLRKHMYNAAVLSRRLGSCYGLVGEDLRLLEMAAGFHDVGKRYISSRILFGQGRLSSDEYEIIKAHSAIGADILRKDGFHEKIVEAVRHHHERWDGSGYPDGLRGENIPLFSRIISVADAYDAMVSGRPYKKAVSPFKALNEIFRCSGSQFDPELVKMFISIMKEDDLACSR
ncbi:MAG: Metal-dependent phosphohydrolase, HD subdomain [Firmicutes bacterium]|nr:Metal-dependent phosphohydrolase, HD subdomain [Bacillota bacterium]MDI6707453.1 HD-GYP domain-containing protein [Bacillota bacterium]